MSLILILCREKNFQNIEAERTQPVIEPSLNKSDSLKSKITESSVRGNFHAEFGEKFDDFLGDWLTYSTLL